MSDVMIVLPGLLAVVAAVGTGAPVLLSEARPGGVAGDEPLAPRGLFPPVRGPSRVADALLRTLRIAPAPAPGADRLAPEDLRRAVRRGPS